MLPVNLKDITPVHIQDPLDSEMAESLTLEFKRDLPSGQNEEKREFLYDVAGMANAGGGDIVFGIADRRGRITSLPASPKAFRG
jgi:predicted HTH transcriptional regulator